MLSEADFERRRLTQLRILRGLIDSEKAARAQTKPAPVFTRLIRAVGLLLSGKRNGAR